VRQVDVVQEDGIKIVFTSTISFKRSDKKYLNVQVKENLAKKYDKLLNGKKVQDLPMNSEISSMMYDTC
jgi:hypothetical protein